MSKLSSKDFISDNAVRWCPGCGDFAVLSAVQKLLPTLGIPKEQFAFVSGIGCAGRFPHYLKTFGFHTLHGRATAVATGLKLARPDLSVWIVTGDGDGLSIGGNHMLHLLRRNLDVTILLFNNRIYGLTKGQFSPTSETGKITVSSPQGAVGAPVNPLAFALGAGATFIARAVDVDAQGLQSVLRRAAEHRGTSLVEIYQNCHVYNDKAFAPVRDKATRAEHMLWLEDGKPMRYGTDNDKGLHWLGHQLTQCEEGADSFAVHDQTSVASAFALTQLMEVDLPVPMGVLYAVDKPTMDERLPNRPQGAVAKTKDALRQLFTL